MDSELGNKAWEVQGEQKMLVFDVHQSSWRAVCAVEAQAAEAELRRQKCSTDLYRFKNIPLSLIQLLYLPPL